MKNPYLNAIAAGAYIVAIVCIMTTFTDRPGVNGILVPMVMLSLFTLSASVMGYLFVFQPVRMYLEGQKTEGVQFFLKTVATFAVIAFGFLTALYFSF